MIFENFNRAAVLQLVLSFVFVIVMIAGVLMLLLVISSHGDKTQKQRWEEMCAGAARYDAMREASERGKPNPC